MRSCFPLLLPTLVSSALVGAGPVAIGANTPAHKEIYERGNAQFEEAWFLKPVETNPDDLTFKLAPLLLQEVPAGTNRPAHRPAFGALTTSNGNHQVDLSRPVVYVHPDTVLLLGKLHARLTYLWFYPGQDGSEGQGPVLPQAVRITLNASGEPAFWEILTDHSQLDLVFVSEKVEGEAAVAFGAPVEGRRHAVEASPTQAPRTVVARVIDDGPVAMGPMLYVGKEAGEVMTLICRCMASQAKRLAGMSTYELQPWAHQLPRPARVAFWPGDATPGGLEQQLRLPDKL